MRTRLPLALALVGTFAVSATGFVMAQSQPPAGAPAAPPAASRAAPPPPPVGAPGAGPETFMDGPRGGMMGFGAPRHRNPADRAAFLDARIVSVKAGLRLTPDQDKLWSPLEAAVRDGAKRGEDLRRAFAEKGRPADPVEGLSRMADMSSARGETLRRIAEAARPFYAGLTDEQRRRLPALLHAGSGGWRERMGERMHHWREWGDEHFGRGHGERDRRGDRDDRGPRDRS